MYLVGNAYCFLHGSCINYEMKSDCLRVASKCLWRIISAYVNRDCLGCCMLAHDHVHTCLYLYNDYYLFNRGWLKSFYDTYYETAIENQDFKQILDKHYSSRQTRYKKRLLRNNIFSELLSVVPEGTTNNCTTNHVSIR